MEGVYQHLKYMGFEEDMNAIDEMKKRYYSLYFKKNKEEKSPPVERATVNRLVPGSNPGEGVGDSRAHSGRAEGFCESVQVAGSNPVRGFVAIMTCLKNK